MVSSSVKFLPIALMTWVTISLVSSTPEMGINELSYLGTVEGKSFFLEKNFTNWTDAKQRCEGAGMHLSTITTSAQLTMLNTFYNVTGSSYYWTGARDSQTPSQFLWDYDNSTLSSSLFTGYNTQIGVQTCVAYRATSPTVATFHFLLCGSSRFTLCEIIHNRNA